MELEVWPNFVTVAKQLNVPVVVVNGRISDRGFARYQKVRPLVKKIFGGLSLVLVQTEEYTQRFAGLGVKKEDIVVTGSLKYDTAQVADKIDGAAELTKQLNLEGKRLWVAGGTGDDEETLLLDAYRNLQQQKRFSDLRLAIVPRKPERFNETAQMIKQKGFALIRYSEVKKLSSPPMLDNQAVILGDTMGDLRKFYSLATVIFVGRSLVPMGGSDMMEAAALGKCTIFGPYAFNFKQTVDELLAGNGAIMVKDKKELQDMLEKCLSEPDFSREIAHNGREVIIKNQGATLRSIENISKFLEIGFRG